MEENKSYVMWNNKGGVGKSTITFHVASVYAEQNLDRDVVVVDMCPQANSSSMLMGGGNITPRTKARACERPAAACGGELVRLVRRHLRPLLAPIPFLESVAIL